MKQYTFVPMGRTPEGIVQRMAEPKVIEAMSLKKAIKKYSVPTEFCKFAVINWSSKKGNASQAVIQLPYVSRKERKGKLWGQDMENV